MRGMLRFFSVFVLFAVPAVLAFGPLAPSATAQIPPTSSTTSTPVPGAGHDYLGGQVDTVNPATGSISIRIPVIMPPGRGITLPFAFAYDSNGVNYLGTTPVGNRAWYTANSIVSTGGWSNTAPLVSVSILEWTVDPQQNVVHGAPAPALPLKHCSAYVNYLFQDPVGNRHNLNLTTYSDPTMCISNWPNGFEGEIILQGGEGPVQGNLASSSITLAGHVTATDGDGTVYTFAANEGYTTFLANSVTDRNGNTVTVSPQGGTSGAFSYEDTTGRTVLQDSGFAINPETVTVSGLGAPYQLSWTPLSTPTFRSQITTVFGTCDTPSHQTWYSKGLSTLTLPNGQSFSFTYDSTYGLVNRINYPTGGYVRYVWGMNNNAEGAQYQLIQQDGGTVCGMLYGIPSITDRYVSFDGSTEVLHQQFTYSTTPSGAGWSSKTTTVTTHDLVRNTNYTTVYSYSAVDADLPPNTEGGISAEDPVESSVVYNDTNGSPLETVSKTWANVRVLMSQQNAFPNGQSSLTLWCYNSYELVTEKDDYDFGSGTPSQGCTSPPSGAVSGGILRKTVTNYATFNASLHILDKPSSVIVYNGSGGKAAETDYTYDNPLGQGTSGIVQHITGCNCGNLTKQAQWLNSSGATLTTSFTNDDTGQRLTMTDPAGNQTTYSYTDNYSSGSPPGPTNAYLTKITYPSTANANHIEQFSYAYASGEVTSSIDQNNLTTTYKYNDNLARLTETDFPDGGQTLLSYNDAPYNPSTPSPSVTTTKKINAAASVVSVAAMDGLGHHVRSLLTSDPQGTIYTDTAYDGPGRVYTVSNPYRSGSDPTTSSGTTVFVYDGLGRKTSETAPDGSVIATAYCAGSTLVTDPTGRWRRSRTDGLGRLAEVDEPNAVGATVNSNGCPAQGDPVWVTSYTLDTLGNLTGVVQNGSHQRSFSFDFVSRMTSSTNPEVGTITYNWDADSNCPLPSYPGALVSKVDARSIRICYQYDQLHRELASTYSNGDPTITTAYDQPSCLGLTSCANVGHRTSVTDAAGSEAWSYQVDFSNQRSVHADQRTTASGGNNYTKTSTYYLDLAGNVTQVSYPTGRVVNYTFDAADRPSTAADASNGITYATDFQSPPTGCLTNAACYTPQGSFYALSIGQTSSFTGLNLSHSYNNRLQPLEFKASSTGGSAIDITYSFVDPVSGKNAGHVFSIANNLNSSRSQSFTYDQVNRILSAGTLATTGQYCWGYQYSYDAWGNLLSQAGWTPNYSACTETLMGSVTADGNNHISGFSYDASGNTQNDGTYPYTWDAESQMKSAAGVNYAYDGDGRRVFKSSGKLYWYGAGGDILAETDASGSTTAEYIFFGGKRIAMLPAGGNAQFYVEDFLGSSRVVTQNNGVVCYDADFTPFGGDRPYTDNCPAANNYKFEGKERDTETGNDDFGARYYSWRFGRWLSADWSAVPVPVPYANLTNPQTLNLYAMVADDPESFADLDGHDQNDPCVNNPRACAPQTTANANATNATTGVSTQQTGQSQQQAAQNEKPHPKHKPKPKSLPSSGEASIYADKFEGKRTASGETFHQSGYTAALLPKSRWDRKKLGRHVRLTHGDNTVVVEINDFGRGKPGQADRALDLSHAAASVLIGQEINDDDDANQVGLIHLNKIETVPGDTPLGPPPPKRPQ